MNTSSSLRNLIIFTIVTLGCGWLGVWINTQVPSPSPQQSLGLLIWILAPLLTALILRSVGKDGWSDFGLRFNFKGNLGWYLFAFLLYPITIAVTLLLGGLFGVVSFDGLASKGFSALVQVIIVGLAASLIKNIFEEFAWRGYLTPRFQALGLSNIQNHLLTGVIWALWHVPYWLYFLGEETITRYTSLGMTGFIIMGLLGIFPLAFVLGELRLKTNSVWPSYLAHNITNALTAPLILDGFVKLNPSSEIFFAPGTEGIVMMILFFGAWFWMAKRKAL
jgi:membrane protease YdiL (CAAX protease family)